MAGLDRFVDVVGVYRDFTFPGDTVASQVFTVLSNVRVTVYKRQADGTREAGTATIYSSRSGTAKTNPFTTAAGGGVDFFANPGEYEIDFLDLNATARIAPFTIHWSAVPGGFDGLAASQLPGGGAGLPVAGDLKHVGKIAVGQADPTGWLWCDGRIISRTTYADLFAAISTSFNSGGETASQFRIPDLRGRVAPGADNLGTAAGAAGRVGSNAAIGNASGASVHTLGTAELPAHTHPLTDPGHAHESGTFPRGPVPGQNTSNTGPLEIGTLGVSISASTTGITIGNTGGGSAHNNMPPYQCVGVLIKT